MQRHPVSLNDIPKLVSNTDILIYAPPAYGKTTYQTNRSNQLDISVFDTDDLDCPPDSGLEILLTNYHQLLTQLNYRLAIIFLPPEDQFRSGCEHRNLAYQSQWYADLLSSVNQSSLTNCNIIITSGKPLLHYDKFIRECYQALFRDLPLPSIPSVDSSPPLPSTTATEVLHATGRVTVSRQVILPGINEQYQSAVSDTTSSDQLPADTVVEIINNTLSLTDSPVTSETVLESTSTSTTLYPSSLCTGSSMSCDDLSSTTSLMKLRLNGVVDQLNEPFLPVEHYPLGVEGYYDCWTTGNLVLMKRAQIRFYVSRYLFEKWKAMQHLWLRR